MVFWRERHGMVVIWLLACIAPQYAYGKEAQWHGGGLAAQCTLIWLQHCTCVHTSHSLVAAALFVSWCEW
jgi:hypothetical protein